MFQLIKVSVLFVIGVFAGSSIAASIDCNIDECRKPMKIYEELRCKPIYGAKSCCPKRFECGDNVRKIDTNLCAFDGKTYKVGDVLRRKFSNDSKCLETCICSSSDNEPVKFLCSNNCVGISDTKVDDGCVKIYTDVKECCSTTTVCAEDEKKNLATCWDNSVSHREGEKFISKSNPCYECLCHKDFDNSTITENSHCRKLNCDIELKYKTFIQRGCLPIFEDDKCCPIDWKCPDDERKRRDVTEIEDGIDVSNESIEDEYSSTETSEEITESVTATTASSSLVTLNLDPYRTPKVEETSMVEEQTKSLDENESPTEYESLPVTISTFLINEESSTTEVFNDEKYQTEINEENDVTLPTTETTTSSSDLIDKILEDIENEEITTNNIPSEHNEANTEEAIFNFNQEEEEITTVPSYIESSKESDMSTTEQILRNEQEIPKTDLEAPKLEISTDLEVPLNSLDEHTTIFPQSTTFEASTEITTESEKITSTTKEAIVTQPTVVLVTNRTPRLIIKPSTHVIPPPPSPTEFEQLLTTLKEYVERLENTLAATKASEIDPPATFVNYTVSRSFNENEKGDEEKSRKKRSALDFLPRYFKHANKEKGCTYGKRQYKLGEKIRTDNECLDCLCLYSPIGHCTKKKQCIA